VVFAGIGTDVRPPVNPATTPVGTPSTESVTGEANPLRP
jgi:hypothetical protein